jgi:hypothetical protein
MLEDLRAAHVKAVHLAVVERTPTCALGDEFRDWHWHIGRNVHGDAIP